MDNDPIVLLHARALLTSSPQGATAYIEADLRDTGTILAEAARCPGLRPAGRGDDARGAALHPGSGRSGRDRGPADRRRAAGQLPDHLAPGQRRRRRRDGPLDGRTTTSTRPSRSPRAARRGLARSSIGLDLVEPGLVQLHRWRPGVRRPGHAAATWPTTAASAASPDAPRGASSYPRCSREELGGRFLGLMAYLDPKGEGDNSMPGKQRSCSGV